MKLMNIKISNYNKMNNNCICVPLCGNASWTVKIGLCSNIPSLMLQRGTD